MKYYKKLIIILLLVTTCLLTATSVFAKTITERMKEKISSAFPDLPGYDPGTTSPELIAGRAVGYLLGFLGVLFLVLIIYGGYMWMTSGGNEEQVTKAKKIIIASTIGLAIIISAAIITAWIFNAFVTATTETGPIIY